MYQSIQKLIYTLNGHKMNLKYYVKVVINNFFADKSLITVTSNLEWNDLLKLYSIKSIKSIDEVVFLSYYKANIPRDILKAQKDVFNYFKLNIIQLQSELSHGDFLNNTIPKYLDKKLIVCFDIDCVPLSKNAIISIIKDIDDENTLAGAIQTANHKQNGENIYVGPFFMGFSTKLYQALKPINFNADENHDVGGQFTKKCRENNKNIKYWYPTHVELPKWKLYPNGYFGIGTTYNGLVFHNFEIRINAGYSFKRICKSITKGKFQ